jgi:eukaryotic-like serine/threonine-protein kinase
MQRDRRARLIFNSTQHAIGDQRVSKPSALPEPGDIIAGKYRVERVIGSGGMGSVFEVRHRVTDKRFAVKWLLPGLSEQADAVARFIREAQVAGRFQHPNVVEVYDVGEDSGSFYMVMELLFGDSLATHLRHSGKLSVVEACTILIPCMKGVARGHDAGVIHRDLKPANIFLCRSPHDDAVSPKVLDFGISKLMQSSGDVNDATKAGVVMGTPHYMAPEQIRGKGVDHRTDIYAFGVLLYQLLSGRLPFPGVTYSELVLQIATETPKSLLEFAPGTPPALVEVVQRAMARSPAERFENLGQMARALEPFAAGAHFDTGAVSRRDHFAALGGSTVQLDTPMGVESHPSIPPITIPPARRLWWLVTAAAAGVLGLGYAAYSLRPLGEAPRVTTHAAAIEGTPTAATPLPETIEIETWPAAATQPEPMPAQEPPAAAPPAPTGMDLPTEGAPVPIRPLPEFGLPPDAASGAGVNRATNQKRFDRARVADRLRTSAPARVPAKTTATPTPPPDPLGSSRVNDRMKTDDF